MSTRDYYLYLDESGNFDEDLLKESTNECLVGGFLSRTKLPEEYEIDNEIVDMWKTYFSEQTGVTIRKDILEKIHHATEIDRELKSELCYYMLKEVAAKHGEFVVFENYEKNSVVDSTITYINILAEGIVQLMTNLVLEDLSQPVKLNIVAGYRRDMTVEKEEYIKLGELKKRIDERIAILEIKNQSLAKFKASYSIELGNDKTNTYLILCDYICNFYFTRNKKYYNKFINSELTIAEELLRLYDSNNIFSLKGCFEKERIFYAISNEAYGNLLFDIATGLITEKDSIDKVISIFLLLSEKDRMVHLDIFCSRIKVLIDIKRNLELSKKVLEFANFLCEQMEEKNILDTRFKVEIVLFNLAVANHKGELLEMERLFKEALQYIPELLAFSDNIGYIFMLINRYAVYLIDTLDVSRARDLLEDTITQFEAYELMGDELVSKILPYMNANLDGNIKWADQKARLLGTKVQAETYLMRMGTVEYDDAVETSENAISNFKSEADKRRQYQYRAALEGYYGNIDEAYKYLLMGLGVARLTDITDKDMNANGFILYHVSLFFKNFSSSDRPEVKDVWNLLKNHENKYLKNSSYPDFVTAGNVAYGCSNISGSKKDQVAKYYKSAICEAKDDTAIFVLLKLMIRCNYVAYLKKNEDKNLSTEVEKVNEICEYLLSQNIPEEMRRVLKDFTEDESTEKYQHFANKSHY